MLDLVGNTRELRKKFLCLGISHSNIVSGDSRNTESLFEDYLLNKYIIQGQGLSTKCPKLRIIILQLPSAGMGQNLLEHMRTSLNLQGKKKIDAFHFTNS